MTFETFEAMPLTQPIQSALKDMGFTKPSPIQAQAIPVLLEGRDVIGQAQTGTGKTAAFAIPMIERVHVGTRHVQALVLCPTRELAVQVSEEIRKLAKHVAGLAVVSIYGGEPINRQFRALKQHPQIVVATPGRLQDHLQRGSIRLSAVKTVVLDEADEMLDMGFRPDIERILNGITQDRQTVLFSATMSKPILELAGRYQRKPEHVKVEASPAEPVKIEQLYVEVQRKTKLSALTYLLKSQQCKLAVVFCNTKWQVDDLVRRLKTQGYQADGLHGGMAQNKRDKVMQGFRKGQIHFLVATDVAARGIDVSDVEAVFNYDFPKDIEFYLHRIGRTGRAGKSGRAYTFLEQTEMRHLKQLRRTFNADIARQEVPALA